MGPRDQRSRRTGRAVISRDALGAWRTTHPWADDEQVEQDLIVTRVAVEIASHHELSDRLVWRGGTCLHKLFLPAPLRYSEDLDYVAYGLSIEDNDMRRSGLREVAEVIGLEVSKHAKTTSSRLTEHLGYTSLGGLLVGSRSRSTSMRFLQPRHSIAAPSRRTPTGGPVAPTS